MFAGLPIAARFDNKVPLSQQLARFFAELVDRAPDGSWLIGTTDLVVWGAILLGITSGALGCFIVLRRQSLLGDAIAHAVLPDVCVGFMFAGSRSTPALLGGALVAGIIATALLGLRPRTTTPK